MNFLQVWFSLQTFLKAFIFMFRKYNIKYSSLLFAFKTMSWQKDLCFKYEALLYVNLEDFCATSNLDFCLHGPLSLNVWIFKASSWWLEKSLHSDYNQIWLTDSPITHGLIQMPPLHLIGSLEYLSPAHKKTEDIKLLTLAAHVGSVIAKFVFDWLLIVQFHWSMTWLFTSVTVLMWFSRRKRVWN